MWQVPYTGTYIIESRGAAGANATCRYKRGSHGTWSRGGLGAKISGNFWLTHGTLLKIIVGQRGMMNTDFSYRWYFHRWYYYRFFIGGGGGGGSFVTYVNNTPLVIAGGGGGGGANGGGGGGCVVVVGKSDGDPGQLGVLGSRCNSTVGNGGMLCLNKERYKIYAGSGAGLLSNGTNNSRKSRYTGTSAGCFVHGGRGGTLSRYDGDGGFGGGGFGLGGGGGGGGYTGGGVWADSTNSIAGGGSSVNHGFDKQSGYGDTLQHGLVKIVFLG